MGQLDGGIGKQVMRYLILAAGDDGAQISDGELAELFLAAFGGPLFLD